MNSVYTYTILEIIRYAWHARRDALAYVVTEFLPSELNEW